MRIPFLIALVIAAIIMYLAYNAQNKQDYNAAMNAISEREGALIATQRALGK